MGDQYALWLKHDSPLLIGVNGRPPVAKDVLHNLGQSEEAFARHINAQRIPQTEATNKMRPFTGTIGHKMAVLVLQAVDISQPKQKQIGGGGDGDEDENEQEDSEANEDGFGEGGEKLVSAYLNNEHYNEATPQNNGPSANRLNKFTMFDGVNKFMAMEYEMLSMVYDFRAPGIILAIKPPIQVRKGMCLLKKQNCEVLYQPEPKVPPPKQQPQQPAVAGAIRHQAQPNRPVQQNPPAPQHFQNSNQN